MLLAFALLHLVNILSGTVIGAFYLAFALFYLRKKKRASIVDRYSQIS